MEPPEGALVLETLSFQSRAAILRPLPEPAHHLLLLVLGPLQPCLQLHNLSLQLLIVPGKSGRAFDRCLRHGLRNRATLVSALVSALVLTQLTCGLILQHLGQEFAE